MSREAPRLAVLDADFDRLVEEHGRVLAANGDSAESEWRFRELLEALPAAVYTTDAAGRLTFYNQAAAELWGYRPELGRQEWCGSWRLFRPDGTPLPHDECPMAVALKEGRPVRDTEAIAERPDGTRVPFMPFPTPLRDGSGAVIGAVNMLVDITHRKQAEERLELLAREVNHRANNLLALVQATVRLTEADTVEDFKASLEGRIRALAQAHGLLARSRWVGAKLRQLVEEELAPFRQANEPRARVDGPDVLLSPTAAQSIAVALHELATNAAKYGALSVPGGRVQVDWQPSDDGRVVFRWAETGGPAVTPPTRRGFGLTVVEQVIRLQLEGEVRFDWRTDGLVCEIVA
jgi:PAS domain S-box-containing protein